MWVVHYKHMERMCKRPNYIQSAPQYEGDCEYRISSICGDFTLRYASENNFANLRSGEVFFQIIVIFEACGERPGAVNWMHDNYR